MGLNEQPMRPMLGTMAGWSLVVCYDLFFGLPMLMGQDARRCVQAMDSAQSEFGAVGDPKP